MEISRVDTPRIHQGFSRIGVDVRYVLPDFCLRTVSCSPAKQHGRRFGTLEYPTRDDGFSNYFRTAGSPCPTAATLPHRSQPLPHHRQSTIVIEMESSSGKLLQTLRCLSC